MESVKQQKLLLWKHWTIRKRQPIILSLEFLWPIAIFLIITSVRHLFPPELRNDCVYRARALPSAGLLPFMQSFLCNLDNKCENLSSYEEIPIYKNGKISHLLNKVYPLIGQEEVHTILSQLPTLMTLASHAVKALTTEQSKEILSHSFTVGELFKDNEVVKNLLIKNQLDAELAKSFLDTNIDLGRLVTFLASNASRGLECRPDDIITFLKFKNGSEAQVILSSFCQMLKQKPVIHTLILQLNVRGLLEKAVAILQNLGSDDLASALSGMGKIVDGLQSIPILEKLASAPLGAETGQLSGYLQHAIEFLKTIKDFNLDLNFLGELINDIEQIAGPGDVINHMKEIGKHLQRIITWSSQGSLKNADLVKTPNSDIFENGTMAQKVSKLNHQKMEIISIKGLAKDLQDMLSHVTFIGNKFGGTLRDAYPAFDITWKIATTAISILLLPDQNDSIAFVNGLASIFETFPGYLPSEMRMPGLYFISAIEVLLKVGVNISRTISESNQIFLNDMNVNKKLWEQYPLEPDTFMSLSSLINRHSVIKVLSQRPNEFQQFICNSTSEYYSMTNETEDIYRSLRNFICNLPLDKVAGTIGKRENLLFQMENSLSMNGETDIDTAFRTTIRTVCLLAWELFEIFQNITNNIPAWKENINNLRIASPSDPMWRAAILNLRTSAYHLIIDVYADKIVDSLENSPVSSRDERVMNNVATMINLLSNEFLKVPGQVYDNLVTYWPWVIQIFLDSLDNNELVELVVSQSKWSAVICNQTEINKYLIIPDEIHSQQFLEFFCKLSTYVENDVLSTNWFEKESVKLVREQIDDQFYNYTKTNWKKTFGSVSEMLSKCESFVSGSLDNLNHIDELWKKSKLVLTKMNLTHTIKLSFNAFTIVMEFVDRQLETVLPWGWKHIKALLSVLDIFIQYTNQQMKKIIAENKVETGSLTFGLKNFTDLGRKVIRSFPVYMNSLTSMFTSRLGDFIGRVFQVVRSKALPCEGLTTTSLIDFSEQSKDIVLELESTACSNWKFIISEIIQYPMMFKMLWKFREATRDRDLILNWNDVRSDVMQLIDYSVEMSTFNGLIFPDVEGFKVEEANDAINHFVDTLNLNNTRKALRFSMVILDAMMPLFENLIKKEWIFQNLTVAEVLNKSFLDLSIGEKSDLSYMFVKVAMKTFDIVLHEMTTFYQNSNDIAETKDTFTHLPILFGEMFYSFPNYINSFIQLYLKGNSQKLIDDIKNNKPSSTSEMCHLIIANDLIEQRNSNKVSLNTVLPVLCKLLYHPEQYFSSEPFAYSWMLNAIKKLVILWQNPDPSTIIVHFVDIVQAIGFTMDEKTKLVGNRLDVKKEFNDLVANEKWNEVVESIVRLIVKLEIESAMKSADVASIEISSEPSLSTLPAQLVCVIRSSLRKMTDEANRCVENNKNAQENRVCKLPPNSSFTKFWKFLDDHLINIFQVVQYTIAKNPSKIKLLLDSTDSFNLTCASPETFFNLPESLSNKSISLQFLTDELCKFEWEKLMNETKSDLPNECAADAQSLVELSDDFANFLRRGFGSNKFQLPRYLMEATWKEAINDLGLSTIDPSLSTTQIISNSFEKLTELYHGNSLDSFKYINHATNVMLATLGIIKAPFNENIWKVIKGMFINKPQSNKMFNMMEGVPKLASVFLNTAINSTKTRELMKTIWTFDSNKTTDQVCQKFNMAQYFIVPSEMDISFAAFENFTCGTDWPALMLEINPSPAKLTKLNQQNQEVGEAHFNFLPFFTSFKLLIDQLQDFSQHKLGVLKTTANELPWTRKGEWRSAVVAIDRLQQNLKDPKTLAEIAVEYLSIIEEFPDWQEVQTYLQFLNLQFKTIINKIKAMQNSGTFYNVITNVSAMNDIVKDVHRGVLKATQLLQQYAVLNEISFFEAHPNHTAFFCQNIKDLRSQSVDLSTLEKLAGGQMTINQLLSVCCNIPPSEWLSTFVSDFDVSGANAIAIIKNAMEILPTKLNSPAPFNWSMLLESFQTVNQFLQNPPDGFYPNFEWTSWQPVLQTFGYTLPEIIRSSGETICPLLPKIDYAPFKELITLLYDQLMNAEEYEKLICDLPTMNLSSIYHRLKHDLHLIDTLQQARIQALKISLTPIADTDQSCPPMFDATSKVAKQLNEMINKYTSPYFKEWLEKCFRKETQAVIVKEIDKYSKLISKGMPLLNFPNISSLTDSTDIQSLVETILDYLKFQVPVFFPIKNILVLNSTLNRLFLNTPGEEVLVNGMINLNMLATSDFKPAKIVDIFCSATKFSKFVKLTNGQNGEVKQLLSGQILCPRGDKDNGLEIVDMFLSSLDVNKIINILPKLQIETLLSWNLVVSVGKNIGKLGLAFVDLKSAMGNVDFKTAFDNISIQGIARLILPVIHSTSLQKLANGLEVMVEVLAPVIAGSSFEDKLMDIAAGVKDIYIFMITNLRNETIPVKDLVTDVKQISTYLLNLDYPLSNIDLLMNTSLNFSVILFERKISKLEDMFCDLDIMPTLFNLRSDLTTAGLLHTTLCDEHSADKINNFMSTIFSHLNVISILKNEMHLFMDPIARKLNLDYAKVKEALQSVFNAQKIFPVVAKTFYSLQMDSNIAKIVSNLNPSELAKGEISGSLITSFGNMLCGHPIRTFEEYFRLLQTTNNRPPPEKEKLELESLPSDFCQAMYKQVAYRPAGSVIWGFLKPFIRGKMLFSPDNEYSRKIISQINVTFDKMSSSIDMIREWSGGFKFVQTFIEDELTNMEDLIMLPIPNSIANSLLGPAITRSISNISTILNGMGNPQKLLGAASALSKGLECFEMNRFVGFATEEQMEKEALALKKSSSFLAGIVFNNFSSDDIQLLDSMDRLSNFTGLPKHIKYKIRMDIDDVPTTKSKKERFWKPGPEDNFIENMRYFRGFVELQDMIDRSIINMQSGNHNATLPGAFVQQFPYPCYSKDEFGYFLRANVPAVTTLAWIFIVAIFVRELVLDRELMVHQVMLVMGLKPWIGWISWFTNCLFVMLLTNIGSAIILKYGGVFPNSDPGLLFVFLFLFSLSTIMFCYLISIWFKRATIAAISAVLLYLASYLPFIVVLTLETQLSLSSRLLLNLLMSTAFSQGCVYIARFEEQKEGIQWSNIWKSPIFGDEMCLAWTCIMMVVDTFIYFVIAAYFSSLISVWQRSVKKKWYMIFYPVFSIFPKYKSSNNHKFKNLNAAIENSSGHMNKQDSKSRIGIASRNLTKVYYPGKGSQTVAVEDLTMNLYESQITSLLGQSGSGKTTIINMLIGLTTPQSGYATIYDRDVTTEFEEIRKQLGVCPQYNILFELMTIKEHLEFFGRLKGNFSDKQLRDDIAKTIEAMKLKEKENERACNLSGGTRRRLSVAIAFIGGSRTIILDEPTSGVDPLVRRSIWELIIRSKRGKTILLTTHHMDEAEVLSDSVLIIHQGKTLCHGAPMELKKHFGSGYLLNVSKSTNSEITENGSVHNQLSTSSNFKDLRSNNEDALSVFYFAKYYIPNAYLLEDNASKVVLCLPYINEDGGNNRFADFFINFEEQKQKLNVNSYSITCTTLEQVFMNICLQADAGLPITPQGQKILVLAKNKKVPSSPLRDETIKTSEFNFNMNALPTATKRQKSRKAGCEPWLAKSLYQVHYTMNKGTMLKWNQFKWLLIKRLHHFSRNWRAFITCIVLPCIFVAMAMGFTLIRPAITHSSPSLLLTPSIYGPGVSSFIKVHPNHSYAEKLSSKMKEPPGIGTTCMRDKPEGIYPTCAHQSVVERHSITKQQCSCDSPGNNVCNAQQTISLTYDKEITNTTDIVYDLLNGNVTDWLMTTHLEYIEQRYGGWVFGVNKPEESIPGSDQFVVGWFNNKGFHALPSYINSISNAILRAEVSNENESSYEYGISTYNHPLHLSKLQLGMEALMHHVADVGIAIIFLVAFSFIPAGFVMYLVKERVQGEKRLQYLSGVGPVLYWSVAAFFDIVVLAIPIGLSAIIITIFDLPIYMYGHNFIATLAMLFMFGWATTPLMYIFEKFFNEPSLACIILFCSNVFIGVNTTVCTLLFYLFQKNEAMELANKILQYLFLIFPQFALAGGLVELTKNYIQAEVFMRFGDDTYTNPFSMNILGLNLIVMAIQGVVFFIINLMLEWAPGYFSWITTKKVNKKDIPEDVNVKKEREKVLNSSCAGDLIRVKNLSKRFNTAEGEIIAVNNICLSVPKGECFGLLGINGAGKTSTFHMLTGELVPTSGEIYYKSQKISPAHQHGSKNVGYCPQTNSVDELLSAEELLSVYAGLKGIPDVDVPLAVFKAIIQFQLEHDAQNLSKTYSNGTKRKLCAAIAVLGNPELILMDEPTTGMDPTTRRLVWQNIQEITKDNRSVILTSHNMEECDILCTRLAIMKDGQFQCLGSPQYLKNRFGDDYTVSVFVKEDSINTDIIARIRSHFPSAISKNDHGSNIEFIISCKMVELGELFKHLESMKLEMIIQDFSVSKTTLDQIFVDFVQNQIKQGSGHHGNNLNKNLPNDRNDQEINIQATQF